VVELVDALASGASEEYPHGGSSPPFGIYAMLPPFTIKTLAELQPILYFLACYMIACDNGL
jgi:hypothetical protein